MTNRNPVNDTWQKQHGKLVRSTFKKAFIISINTSPRTIDVAFVENPNTVVRNIPLARNVAISSLAVGQKCRVDIFDETNPNDMVVAYSF